MKKSVIFSSFLVTVFIILSSCSVTDSYLPKGDNPNAVYFNSFESEKDIEGWYGNGGGIVLRSESPEGGGTMSAYISGACTHPHSAFEFKAPQNAQLKLNSWAKNMQIGGGLILKNQSTGKEIHISVQDKEWQKYTSEESLTVHRGDKLQLSMSSGGFVSSAMLVTYVEIEKVP